MSTYTLPTLNYAMDALAPHMSAETLEYHHGKHHNAYVNNVNKLIVGTGLEGKSDEEIIKATFGKADHEGLFNNFSQYWNHKHFWNWLKPNGGGAGMPAHLEAAITQSFGGFEQFKEAFTKAGLGQFGSGWAWLVSDDNGSLSVMKTLNGENPVCFGKHAIFGVDVWEHSYYIDYRNGRGKYLEAVLDSLANWDYAASLYEQCAQKAA